MDMEMENSAILDDSGKDKVQKHETRKRGGFITMPFIIANEAFEKVASYGLMPNMILYLIKDYRISVAKGTNILFYWSAATNFMPILGAFVSDSYLGRFLTIGIGCFFSLLGMILLWLTTVIPQVKPPHCDQQFQNCNQPTTGQYGFLLASFALMSIGAGGIRPCSLAFGADQLYNRDNSENKRVLETYFSWYYASTAVAVLIAFTGIVYIQDHIGWRVGFGVPAILMFLSALSFFVASPLYVKAKVERSVIASFARVLVSAFKNRKFKYSSQISDEGYYDNGLYTKPTNKLRFLNKACIIVNPKAIGPDGVVLEPGIQCTVEQVEEVKALVRVIPLWSASIMLSITVSQGSFPTLQAKTMDRHLTSNFQIPAGSFAFFTIGSLMLWVFLYDRIIIPFASRIKGKPVRLGLKLRMGIGLFMSCLGMAVSAIVEHVRRRRAVQEGLLNNPQGMVNMSALWLIPQHCFVGLAEAFNAIGQNEFYYSEFPRSMSAIATALFGLQMAIANLLASVILNAVEKLTGGKGKESWITNNINKGHYENYYWLLAIMSFINLFYYIACALAYGPCVEDISKVTDHGRHMEEDVAKLIGLNEGENGEEVSKTEVLLT